MDELSDRLQRDAERIPAEVSPALRARIDGALGPVPRPASATPPARSRAGLAWASVATGLAAVLLLVVLRAPEPAPQEPEFAATPRYEDLAPPGSALLNAQTAEFTEPLQQELDALQSDLERAAKYIEQDLRNTL